MAVTVLRFLKAFPEFKETEVEHIQQKIDAATLRSSANLGDSQDQYIMTKAAHLLSISPQGEKSRLIKQGEKTIYQEDMERMVREATMGLGRNS